MDFAGSGNPPEDNLPSASSHPAMSSLPTTLQAESPGLLQLRLPLQASFCTHTSLAFLPLSSPSLSDILNMWFVHSHQLQGPLPRGLHHQYLSLILRVPLCPPTSRVTHHLHFSPLISFPFLERGSSYTCLTQHCLFSIFCPTLHPLKPLSPALKLISMTTDPTGMLQKHQATRTDIKIKQLITRPG